MRSALKRDRAASAPHYQRRRPEQTPLHRLVRAHYEMFAADVGRATSTGLPQFVKDDFDAYLECGILAYGFLRLSCDGCARDTLVAFSCKRRDICPSCGTRRMAEIAADLVDHILPRVPVRQWVLSFPMPLEHPPARAGARWRLPNHRRQRRRPCVSRSPRAHRRTTTNPAQQNDPAHAEVTHLGHLIEEEGITYLARTGDIGPDNVLAPLQAVSSTCRIAMGPRAGRKVLSLQNISSVGWVKPITTHLTNPAKLCANVHGFSRARRRALRGQ